MKTWTLFKELFNMVSSIYLIFSFAVLQENLSTEELEQFAKELKHKRITLGFTQADVGLALGNLYGMLIPKLRYCVI